MRKGLVAIAAALLLCTCPATADGAAVSSSDLIDRAQEYDSQQVTYSGEVVGDILDAGDHVWVNASDGNNAVGIWVDRERAGDIQLAGQYGRHGDVIAVTGTFFRVCPEHGGDFDIHADSIELVTRGYTVAHDVTPWKLVLGSVLSLGALGCMLMFVIRSRRAHAGQP